MTANRTLTATTLKYEDVETRCRDLLGDHADLLDYDQLRADVYACFAFGREKTYVDATGAVTYKLSRPINRINGAGSAFQFEIIYNQAEPEELSYDVISGTALGHYPFVVLVELNRVESTAKVIRFGALVDGVKIHSDDSSARSIYRAMEYEYAAKISSLPGRSNSGFFDGQYKDRADALAMYDEEHENMLGNGG